MSNFGKITALILVFILAFFICQKYFFSEKRIFSNKNYSKIVFVNDNGFLYKTKTNTNNLKDFLVEQKIKLKEKDLIYSQEGNPIFSGTKIKIDRSQEIVIKVDGKEIKNHTLSKTVSQVIKENNLTLNHLDQVSPNLFSPPRNGEKIIITRINVEEKIIEEDIKFKTVIKKSSKLGWREEKTEQKGEKGTIEVKYKITYKNGKEIQRKVLEKNTTKKPQNEIIIKGTYIKLGKTHKGQGTWYAQPENIQKAYPSITGYYGANPWLPKGSYAKVTNKTNGKSIIIVINDRGPFGAGRIIDLDKKAFSEIASLGAGVIDIKVEEILN